MKEALNGMRIVPNLVCLLWIAPAIAVCQSVQDNAAAARSAFAAGQYSRAIKLYEEELTAHPHSAELQSDLGLAYQMEGEHTRAIRSYVAALRLSDMPHTRELLAIERCRLREYPAVAPLLAQIAEHVSKDDELLPVLSSCYLLADDPLDALRVGQAMALSDNIPSDQVLIYRSHAAMGASSFFIDKLRKAPEGASFMEYLKAARDSGSVNARSGFPSAIAHSPYLRPDLSLDEGLALFSKHSDDPALLYFLSVLTGEQAMQSILECQQEYPDSPRLAQFQAQMLVHQGRYKEAETIYTLLLASHPELPDLRHEAAMLDRSQGEWENALAIFRDQLAADFTDDRAVTGISESLIQLGRYADAVEFLAPRFSSSSAPLWEALDLSLAYQKLGKYEKAVGVLSGAEKLYPGDKSIHFRLIRLYTLTGQLDLAKKESSLFAGVNQP